MSWTLSPEDLLDAEVSDVDVEEIVYRSERQGDHQQRWTAVAFTLAVTPSSLRSSRSSADARVTTATSVVSPTLMVTRASGPSGAISRIRPPITLRAELTCGVCPDRVTSSPRITA